MRWHPFFVLVFVLATAGMISRASFADPGALTLEINLAQPSTYELVQPLRMSCMRSAIARGSTQEEAQAALSACVLSRLLASAELERSIRVLYPDPLTHADLRRCIDTTDEDRPLLACIRSKSPPQEPAS